jgi:rhodanese-related sulfurtransferase
MGLLNAIFGINSNSKKVIELLNKGAIIIDVRSTAEFKQGNVPNSENIPLNEFESRIDDIAKIDTPIILCCLSGKRSSKAFSILKEKRNDCLNAGSWKKINTLIKA